MELNGWVLEKLQDLSLCSDFDCGDEDLNEYFCKDRLDHREQLLTQAYCFYRHKESLAESFAQIDFCNDSVRLNDMPNRLRRPIPQTKQYPFYPAIKITRLGVRAEVRGKGVGSRLLETVKYFFLCDNRTGCRMLTVDAYNRPEVIKFYRNNHFEMFKTGSKEGPTVPMIFDLKRFEPPHLAE